MKKSYLAGLLTVGAVVSGCGGVAAQPAGWHTVIADEGALLAVRVEGTRLTTQTSGRAHAAEIVHRVIRGEDGGTVFSYDVMMKKTADRKQFRLQLLPAAGSAPTFAAKREVTARADEDLVRVELMEQADTHEKIVDVYRLTTPSPAEETFGAHVIRVHNQLYRWVHGG